MAEKDPKTRNLVEPEYSTSGNERPQEEKFGRAGILHEWQQKTPKKRNSQDNNIRKKKYSVKERKTPKKRNSCSNDKILCDPKTRKQYPEEEEEEIHQRRRRWLAEQQSLEAANQLAASRNQASRNREIEIEFGEVENNPSKYRSALEAQLRELEQFLEEDKEEEEEDKEETKEADNSNRDTIPGPCEQQKVPGYGVGQSTSKSSPKGELAECSNMNKAQKQGLKLHSKALNDLYIAFDDNPAGESIIEKSKIDRDGSLEQNAKITLQWPRGRVHHIFEELFKLYRKTTPTDRLQLKKDLGCITMSATEDPKVVFQELFHVVQKYQYKTIKLTPDDLYATVLRTLPQYLVMHMSKDMSILWQQDAPPFAIIKKMETIADVLYTTMAAKGTKSTDTVCYWCQEKGHTAYQCLQRQASHPKIPRKTNDSNSNNNEKSNSNREQRERPKCSVYGGRHKDVMCWEDDRNAHQQPHNWKSKLKSNDVQGATIDFDFCL
eukprot:jgi/Psemu1/1434/gm1.1434_g